MKVAIKKIKRNTIKTIKKLEENIFLKWIIIVGIAIIFCLLFIFLLWISSFIPENISAVLNIVVFVVGFIQVIIAIRNGNKKV